MPQSDDLLIKIGERLLRLEERTVKQEETLKSLSKWLTHAFKEMGYDFQKIAMLESSRRKEGVQNNIEVVVLDGDVFDPAVQDEIATRLLKNQPSQDGEIR